MYSRRLRSGISGWVGCALASRNCDVFSGHISSTHRLNKAFSLPVIHNSYVGKDSSVTRLLSANGGVRRGRKSSVIQAPTINSSKYAFSDATNFTFGTISTRDAKATRTTTKQQNKSNPHSSVIEQTQILNST